MPSLHRDTSDCYSQLIVRGGLQTGSTTLALRQWPGSSYTYYWPPSGGTVAYGGLVADFALGLVHDERRGRGGLVAVGVQPALTSDGPGPGLLHLPEHDHGRHHLAEH